MTPLLLRESIAAIEETFRDIPRPQRTKRVARALDDEWTLTQERCEELQREDPETDWRKLSDGDLLEYASVLPFMDPPAFRFYFPAFLRYTLRHWEARHGRVHTETMEVLWWQPDLADRLTLVETDLLIAIFQELASTSEGAENLSLAVPPVLLDHRELLAATPVL